MDEVHRNGHRWATRTGRHRPAERPGPTSTAERSFAGGDRPTRSARAGRCRSGRSALPRCGPPLPGPADTAPRGAVRAAHFRRFLEAPPERSDTRERQDLQEQRRNIGETASPATTRASTSRCRAMPSPASPGKPSRGAARSRSNNVFRHRGEGDLQRRWAPRERPSGGPIVRFRGAAFRKVRRKEPGRPFTSPRCPFPGPPRPRPGEATP